MFRVESKQPSFLGCEVSVRNVKVDGGCWFKLNLCHVIELYLTFTCCAAVAVTGVTRNDRTRISTHVVLSRRFCEVFDCELFHVPREEVEAALLPPELLLLVTRAGQLAVVHTHVLLR